MNRCVSCALVPTDGVQRMTPYSSKRFASWNGRKRSVRESSAPLGKRACFLTLLRRWGRVWTCVQNGNESKELSRIMLRPRKRYVKRGNSSLESGLTNVGSGPISICAWHTSSDRSPHGQEVQETWCRRWRSATFRSSASTCAEDDVRLPFSGSPDQCSVTCFSTFLHLGSHQSDTKRLFYSAGDEARRCADCN